ncbi:MAG: hypothetical protein VYE77_03850 [Planctomycetota bacterium]|nr:hypothetical protein [Planctomycetota bacterium]
MVHFSTVRRVGYLAALAVVVSACSRGSSVGDASPRIDPIPLQLAGGGESVEVEVGNYVADRENSELTYEVVSGGGSFDGDIYTNTFGTMGVFEVRFRVTDAAGNETEGVFDVEIQSANYAVVRQDTSGLQLLDTNTNYMLPVAASIAMPAFVAGFDNGVMVFQRGQGPALTLATFDPFTGRTEEIGDPLAQYVTYRGRTSDDQIVFTTGGAADTDLFLFNPRTRLTKELSATVGEADGNAMVNNADLVFYERGVGGQSDIYFYDPAADTTVAVATEVGDEQLLAVLADGGVVFSRTGESSETDLFYFHRSVGSLEIAASNGVLAAQDKAFAVGGDQGQVVFTAQSGLDVDLYFWDPQSGVETQIATGAVHAVEGIGAGNEVVYREEVSLTEHNLRFYDLDDAAAGVLHAAGDLGSLLALGNDGASSWAFVQGSSDLATVSAVRMTLAPSTVSQASLGDLEFGGQLQNGDVVMGRVDGTELVQFDLSGGVWLAPVSGLGLAFAGDGVDDGDFVYSLTVAAQTDLSMWDSSAMTSEVVSSGNGDDSFQFSSQNGTLLFTRVIEGNSNADLFCWDFDNGETQITDLDPAGFRHSYSVIGSYTGSR